MIDNLQHQKDMHTIPNLVEVLNMLIHVEYSWDLPNQLKKETGETE
jgi:hypothetical protein